MAKKAKSKKIKGKWAITLPILTTIKIENNRTNALQPRLGDSLFSLIDNTNESLNNVKSRIDNSVSRKSNMLSLQRSKLNDLSVFYASINALQSLRELDLSFNNLFETEIIFHTLSQVTNLSKINLSNNCLNGQVTVAAGKFVNLEELNISTNQLKSLSASIISWKSIKKFQASNNLFNGILYTMSICLTKIFKIFCAVPNSKI